MGKKRDLVSRYRVDDGKNFRLEGYDPADVPGLNLDKEAAERLLEEGIEELQDLQGKLYAQDRWSLLIILQAMDAAGKDGTIKHVLSGVNPQGVEVSAFKAPSEEELDHDFLWRAARHLPERGRIGIFNRSYYEEVLVVRVHRDLLDRQKLPERFVDRKIWKRRFDDIRAFEKHLWREGTAVRKFFLNVLKEEQKKRLLERIERPEKNWKFTERDVEERRYWNDYMRAYEDAIRATSSKHAPWLVVPADQKWFTRLVVAAAIVEALTEMHVRYPTLGPSERRKLQGIRRALARS